jgi:hypothetical protein
MESKSNASYEISLAPKATNGMCLGSITMYVRADKQDKSQAVVKSIHLEKRATDAHR